MCVFVHTLEEADVDRVCNFFFLPQLKWGFLALGHGNKEGKTTEEEIGTGNKGQVPWGEVW